MELKELLKKLKKIGVGSKIKFKFKTYDGKTFEGIGKLGYERDRYFIDSAIISITGKWFFHNDVESRLVDYIEKIEKTIKDVGVGDYVIQKDEEDLDEEKRKVIATTEQGVWCEDGENSDSATFYTWCELEEDYRIFEENEEEIKIEPGLEINENMVGKTVYAKVTLDWEMGKGVKEEVEMVIK